MSNGRIISSPLTTQIISYENNQPAATLSYTIRDKNVMHYEFKRSSSKTNPNSLMRISHATIPTGLKMAEPVIDQNTGNLIGWNGLVTKDKYGTIKQFTSPQGVFSLIRYDKNGNVIHKSEFSFTKVDTPISGTSPELQPLIDQFNINDKAYKQNSTASKNSALRAQQPVT